MATCNTCKANKVCDHNRFGFENCGSYIPDNADFVEVVRCKDCVKRGTFDCVKSKGDHPTTTKNEEFCCWGERSDT